MLSVPYSRYIFYPIPWYSFLIVLGAFLAILLACREERRLGLPKDTVIDLSLFLLPAGIIGARIYYVLFSWPQFQNNIISVFKVWEGGLAIYGGIIAGIITILVFCKRRKLSPFLLCDIIVPGLALAQSIGRWGNYFNMEAYGLLVSDPRFCFFPLAVQIPADGYHWHLATFFYESVWNFCIFAFLIHYRKCYTHLKHGSLLFSYAYLYAAGRLLIEELRTDSLYVVSSVRISQLLSVLICLSLTIYVLFSKPKLKRRISFYFWTISCLVTLLLLLLYSVFPPLFSSIPHYNILIIMLLCFLILISCFFLCFLPVFEKEPEHADH